MSRRTILFTIFALPIGAILLEFEDRDLYAAPPSVEAASPADVADLISQLSDESDDIRRRAAYRLGCLGKDAQNATDALVPLLKDRHREVRWYAAEAIGRIGVGAQQAVAPLLVAIDDPASSRFMIRASVKSLGQIGSDAKPASEKLMALLVNKDHRLRVTAAVALWRIERYVKSAEVLMQTIETGDDDGPYEAIRAVTQLRITGPKCSQVLVAALGDSQADVRRAAAVALGSQGGEAISMVAKRIEQSKPEVQTAALLALGYLADDRRKHVFYSETTTKKQFSAAAREFSVAIRALVTRFDDPEISVRRCAAITLAKLGPLVIRELLPALQSDIGSTRSGAIASLVALERFLPSGKQPPLIQLLNKRSLPKIVEAMQHDDAEVRSAAVRLLAALRVDPLSEDAKRQLQRALKDENVATRRYAATLLQSSVTEQGLRE